MSATKARDTPPFDVNSVPTRSRYNVEACNYSYEVWLRIDETFATAAAAGAQQKLPVPLVIIINKDDDRTMSMCS
jgi:hypothetical protein